MDVYYDAVKKHERDDALKAAKDTAISSGAYGGLFGALDNMLLGNRSLRGIAMRGLGTGLAAGAVGGGSALLGNAIAGPPSETNPAAYTAQGTLGGALGGGALGAGGGYLLGGGKLAGLKHLPGASRMGRLARESLPLDNLIIDYIKKLMANPSHAHGLKGAAFLGLMGAGLGGLQGFSAGMDQDTARNMARSEEDEDVRRHAPISSY
jgi:hypothetical protein